MVNLCFHFQISNTLIASVPWPAQLWASQGPGKEGIVWQRHKTLDSLQEWTIFIFPTSVDNIVSIAIRDLTTSMAWTVHLAPFSEFFILYFPAPVALLFPGEHSAWALPHACSFPQSCGHIQVRACYLERNCSHLDPNRSNMVTHL